MSEVALQALGASTMARTRTDSSLGLHVKVLKTSSDVPCWGGGVVLFEVPPVTLSLKEVPQHTPYTLHHTPFTLHPPPFTTHPTTFTAHPTLFTIHPIANPKPQILQGYLTHEKTHPPRTPP